MTMHMLTVTVGGDGVGLGLVCPADNGQQMPHELVCRPDGAGTCLARVALAERRLAGCWAGPAADVIEYTPVRVWRDDAGLLWLSRQLPEPPTPEQAAKRLAAATGYARYTEPDAWRMLLVSAPDVELAYRKAEQHGIEPLFLVGGWRLRLLKHLAETAGKSGPEVPQSPG